MAPAQRIPAATLAAGHPTIKGEAGRSRLVTSEAAAQSAPGAESVAVDCGQLVKSFAGGSVVALAGVSLTIRSNEFFTLLGPSGCGKTTLLRLIAGFETQDSGSILVQGQKLDGLAPYRRPVNTVFQSYAVFPHMTVEQNIAFGLQM